MKTLTSPEIAMTAGPFLRLVMMFRERKAKVQSEAWHSLDREYALPDGSSYPNEPDIPTSQWRTDRMTLGPFLTLILTLHSRSPRRVSNLESTTPAANEICPGYRSRDEDPTASFCYRAADALEAAAKVPPLDRASTHYGSGILALVALAQRKNERVTCDFWNIFKSRLLGGLFLRPSSRPYL